MRPKTHYSLDNRGFFRYLYYISLVTVPVMTKFVPGIDSLYILIATFLGLGFSNKSKIFLLFSCTLVVLLQTLFEGEISSLAAIFIRIGAYFAVTTIASELTKQSMDASKHRTEVILSLTKSLDSRDQYTANHSGNVARYCLKIAHEMKLPKTLCEAVYIGGLLHDIGKIGVPESILMKPGRLTIEEFENIKSHPTIGYETIKHISFFKNNGVLDAVLFHHERYDGNGYPHGKKGEEIPLPARILSVADSFDAMTTKRTYRDALELDYVLNEIKSNKGTQFDPFIVDVFLEILEKEREEGVASRVAKLA